MNKQTSPIVVFAPTPLLTVTIENNAESNSEVHVHAGGQGFWVARMIQSLEHSVTLIGPFGGDSGIVVQKLIESEKVDVKPVPVSSSNGTYVHDRRSGERKVVAIQDAGELTRHEVDDFFETTIVRALDAKVIVLCGAANSGVIPSDIYRHLCLDLRKNSCRVVADLSGSSLRAALEGGIDALKISHEELIESGFADSMSRDDILEGIRRIRAEGAQDVAVTRADEPTIAFFENRTYQIACPPMEPRDHRGAGDSFAAALAVGMSRDLPVPQLLRLAASAGTLNTLRRGLGTGREDDVFDLERHIRIHEISS